MLWMQRCTPLQERSPLWGKNFSSPHDVVIRQSLAVSNSGLPQQQSFPAKGHALPRTTFSCSLSEAGIWKLCYFSHPGLVCSAGPYLLQSSSLGWSRFVGSTVWLEFSLCPILLSLPSFIGVSSPNSASVAAFRKDNLLHIGRPKLSFPGWPGEN